MPLLTSNTKIDKSVIWAQKQGLEYEATILQMLPGRGVCKNYKYCIKECLAFTGFAKIFPTVNKARQKRKDLFTKDLPSFMKTLEKELNNLCKRARKKGKTPVCRLNGFTDINWEDPDYYIRGDCIFNVYQEVQFYDYSADYDKTLLSCYDNYHLTFSYKKDPHGIGSNVMECRNLFSKGINIAVVDTLENRKVFNGQSIQGDKHDFRFLDKKGSIVWLTFKK